MKFPTASSCCCQPSWSQLQLESFVLLAELQEVAGVPQMMVPHGVEGLPQVVVLQLQEVAGLPQVVVLQLQVVVLQLQEVVLSLQEVLQLLLQASSMVEFLVLLALVLLAPASFVASALVALVPALVLLAPASFVASALVALVPALVAPHL